MARNTRAILDILEQHLPARGRALEVASGTGEHALAFANAFPGITWQPSDPDPAARASIAAWAESGPENLRAPLDLDVSEPGWETRADGPAGVVLAINLIHISPWEATQGLFAGAARLLDPGGLVYLYGAYRRGGVQTAQSNERFEEWLKGLNPDYGVRDLEAVEAEAVKNGLALAHVIPMPANNFSVIFTRD